MDGFGLLPHGGQRGAHVHEPPGRKALLNELFAWDGFQDWHHYLRVSIGASDLNDPRVFLRTI